MSEYFMYGFLNIFAIYFHTVPVLMTNNGKRISRHEIDSAGDSRRINVQQEHDTKEICKYVAKNYQSLVNVREDRRGSSAECSTDACEATEGRRSSGSGGRGGNESAAIERLDERLESGSGGPSDFRRDPDNSAIALRLRPATFASSIVLPCSTSNLGRGVSSHICPGSPSSLPRCLGIASASANGLPLVDPERAGDEVPAAAKAAALLASRSNAHSRRPSLLRILAASVSLSVPVPGHLSRWYPIEEYLEVDATSQVWLSLHWGVVVPPVLLLRVGSLLLDRSALEDAWIPPYGWNVATASRLRLAHGAVTAGG
jgi:hypothetical protein